jgi:L-lysine 2,3-aminomutase
LYSFKLKKFDPSSQYSPDLSIETKNEIDRQTELIVKDSLTEKEKTELDILVHKYGEVVESVWDVVDGGCSWTCCLYIYWCQIF